MVWISARKPDEICRRKLVETRKAASRFCPMMRDSAVVLGSCWVAMPFRRISG